MRIRETRNNWVRSGGTLAKISSTVRQRNIETEKNYIRLSLRGVVLVLTLSYSTSRLQSITHTDTHTKAQKDP